MSSVIYCDMFYMYMYVVNLAVFVKPNLHTCMVIQLLSQNKCFRCIYVGILYGRFTLVSHKMFLAMAWNLTAVVNMGENINSDPEKNIV